MKVQVQGTIQVEPRLYIPPNGEAVCHFMILDRQAAPDSKGDNPNDCGYFSITAWGKLADQCGQLHKGMEVYVVGDCRRSKYTGLDGKKQYGFDITPRQVTYHPPIRAVYFKHGLAHLDENCRARIGDEPVETPVTHQQHEQLMEQSLEEWYDSGSWVRDEDRE